MGYRMVFKDARTSVREADQREKTRTPKLPKLNPRKTGLPPAPFADRGVAGARCGQRERSLLLVRISALRIS